MSVSASLRNAVTRLARRVKGSGGRGRRAAWTAEHEMEMPCRREEGRGSRAREREHKTVKKGCGCGRAKERESLFYFILGLKKGNKSKEKITKKKRLCTEKIYKCIGETHAKQISVFAIMFSILFRVREENVAGRKLKTEKRKDG